MPNKNALTLALKDDFDKPLHVLPDVLRRRIEGDVFLKEHWDTLVPQARRTFAVIFDNQEHKETELRWGESFKQLKELSEKIEQKKSIPATTYSDQMLKEEHISALREEIAGVKRKQYSWVVMGHYDPKKIRPEGASGISVVEDEKREGHLNFDPQMQLQANEIAEAIMKETKRPVTRDRVAKKLAEQLNISVATVLRRIRKKWVFKKRPTT